MADPVEGGIRVITVGDFMTRDLVTVREDDDLALAESILRLGGIRHLPVVQEGRITGLVTQRDLLRSAVDQVDGDLGDHEIAHCLDVRGELVVDGQDLIKLGQAHDVLPRQVRDIGGDVARQPEIHEHPGSARTRVAGSQQGLGGDDVSERPAARDDEVGAGQGIREVGQRERKTTRRGSQALGLSQRPVDDDQLGGPQPRDRGGRQAAHRAGADDQDAGTFKGSQEIGSQPQSGFDQRHADPVDAGLGMGAFAHPQGLLEQLAESPAGLSPQLGGTKRHPQLSQDLALTNGHRLEATGDGEQVGNRPVLVVDVEMLTQLRERHARGGSERLADLGDRAVEGHDIGIHLDPVAGRQHQRLGDVLAAAHRNRQRRRASRVQSHCLEHGDRRRPVRQSQHDNAHGATSNTGTLVWAAGDLRCS